MLSADPAPSAAMLGVSGWFVGASPVAPMGRAGLVELVDGLGLRRVGAPLVGRRRGGGFALSLLAESHLGVEVDSSGLACLTVFSCVALDERAVERAALRALGAGRMVWADRRPAPDAPGPQRTPAGLRWLLGHPDADAACARLRATLPPGPERLHAFSPHGRTFARRLRGGLLVVHTWPEHGLMTVELDDPAPGWLGGPLAAIGATVLAEPPPRPTRG